MELVDRIKEVDRYFAHQCGKGSNFYKQAWLPVKRAAESGGAVDNSEQQANCAIVMCDNCYESAKHCLCQGCLDALNK